MRLILALLLIAAAAPCAATTYYVRTDGGTPAQCNGTADAPLAGAAGQACAWNSPMSALPAPPYGGTVKTLIAGGDTLLIGAGQYMIGYGAPSGVGNCNTGALPNCAMSPVPSGTVAQPTRILGADCKAPPQLWATQGAYSVINLTGSSNVEVGCLEITDHSACIINHCSGSSGCTNAQGQSVVANACKSAGAFNAANTYGYNGIIASDSKNVSLHDLNIHGMGNAGVRAGRLTDYTMTNVRLFANGYVGWDGDIRNGDKTADTSDHGAMTFTNSEIGFSGCGENYPASVNYPGTGSPIYGCWGQNEGGYGDGIGTGPTSGNWVFQGGRYHHNAQDGIDLLYGDGSNTVTINRVLADGNAGNQVKISGQSTITNSLLIGNCAYLAKASNPGAGWMDSGGDICRAGGDTVAVVPGSNTALNPAVAVLLENNTITGQGNALVIVGSGGNAASTVTAASNIFYAQQNWQVTQSGYPQQASGPAIYNSPIAGIAAANNILWNAKETTGQGWTCPAGYVCKDPSLANASIDTDATGAVLFSPALQSGSPAIGATSISYSAPGPDYAGNARPSVGGGYDIGALQAAAVPAVCPVSKPPTTTPACSPSGNQTGGVWAQAAYPDCGWAYVGGSCPAAPAAKQTACITLTAAKATIVSGPCKCTATSCASTP